MLTINKQSPNVESVMILTLALVVPEREVFECVRGDSMPPNLEKI